MNKEEKLKSLVREQIMGVLEESTSDALTTTAGVELNTRERADEARRAGRRFGTGESFDRSTVSILNNWSQEDGRDYWKEFMNGVMLGIERAHNVDINRVY